MKHYSQLYVLDAKGRPKPEPDTIKWAKWFETAKRQVADEWVEDCRVSTVFLGLDHNFTGTTPILWETMIFNGPLDQTMWRCAGTWEQAEAMHARAVAQLNEYFTRKRAAARRKTKK